MLRPILNQLVRNRVLLTWAKSVDFEARIGLKYRQNRVKTLGTRFEILSKVTYRKSI